MEDNELRDERTPDKPSDVRFNPLSIEAAMLHALFRGRGHAATLVRRVAALTGRRVSLVRRSASTALARLEAAKLCASDEGPRHSKHYRITREGCEAVREHRRVFQLLGG